MSYGKRIAWLAEQKLKKHSVWEQPMMKDIVLFDMDGTLTPPRQAFDMNLLNSIRSLSEIADIGIVSGSDIDYIREQLQYLIAKTEIRFKLHILPCNGTKYYKPPVFSDNDHELAHQVDMKSHLGVESFHSLMRILSSLQAHVSELGIPLSGNFIQYRGSMINWSPIGRTATVEEREQFVKYDNNQKIRQDYLKRLNRKLSLLGMDKTVVCALGGETSFDIYPQGWDKTYALQHFENQNVWFVGDRCEMGGNDKAIYDKLSFNFQSFKTRDTVETQLIIEEKLIPRIKKSLEDG